MSRFNQAKSKFETKNSPRSTNVKNSSPPPPQRENKKNKSKVKNKKKLKIEEVKDCDWSI